MVKVSVLTIVTACACLVVSDKAGAMAIPGVDENGRAVRVGNADLYLKKNPYRPPAKKKVVANHT